MSKQYDEYLVAHKQGVADAFHWIRENLPELIAHDEPFEWQITMNHDTSKTEPDEYDAYDAYFYGGNRSYEVVQNFNRAWLQHIHRNPHHWQHWILIHDDAGKETVFDMPYLYIIEMICDWWSFSFRKGKLDEIFTWYDEHKNGMHLSTNTRKTVEDILAKIKAKLEEKENA